MSAYLLPGVIGLLLGLVLGWIGFSRPAPLRDALGLRRSFGLRSGLYALGASMAGTALMCWLAVIDVDGIAVLPLSAGALIGGALFGIAAGLGGFTPLTAFAGIGGGTALEALSATAGCLLATLALPLLEAPLAALRAAPPQSSTTLFQVTLDEPFLLGGGFLGQGCAGALLMAIAACIPSPRLTPVETQPAGEAEPASAEAPPEAESPDKPEAPPEAEAPDDPETHEAPEAPAEPAAASPEATTPPPLPDDAPEETFVAQLPGEEPLIVDTQLDEAPDDAPDEPEPDDEPEP